VTELAAWISEERNHGHALHKNMIGIKFRALQQKGWIGIFIFEVEAVGNASL